MNLRKLRAEYPEFVYESFAYAYENGNLIIKFHFKAAPDIEFRPTVTVKDIPAARFAKLNPKVLDNLIFHLGLAEIPSYWKATCPAKIVIRAGHLDKYQIAWWKDLIRQGMGQFFYENKIDFTGRDFLDIVSEGKSQPQKAGVPGTGILVPVGGGKDSAVTLELINKNFPDVAGFVLKSLNVTSNIQPGLDLIKKSGVKNLIVAERVVDPRLPALNSRGFLNGHTPFSAYLAFLSVLCAYVFEYKYVAFSNERSSEEGNVSYLGQTINHQYSKTYAFEKKFREYNLRNLSDIGYFSFLRPLYEIQIAKLFSRYPKYFGTIRSCNLGQKTGVWCCRCAKCLSTFMLLFPFLGKDILKVFPKDLYKDGKLKGLERELLSEGEVKPFECVGTRRELVIARNFDKKPAELTEILGEWGDAGLPEKFAVVLKEAVYG